jgi:hypothetical protein
LEDGLRSSVGKLKLTTWGEAAETFLVVASTFAWVQDDACAIIADLGIRAWRNLRVGIADTFEDGLRSSVAKLTLTTWGEAAETFLVVACTCAWGQALLCIGFDHSGRFANDRAVVQGFGIKVASKEVGSTEITHGNAEVFPGVLAMKGVPGVVMMPVLMHTAMVRGVKVCVSSIFPLGQFNGTRVLEVVSHLGVVSHL